MAEQQGFIGIDGKLSDLCFYVLNGKRVVRSVGKVTKARYARDPNFARMRENATELGGASKTGKVLRMGLLPFSKTIGDSYLSGRLNGVLRRMISLGSGKRGQRICAPVMYGHLLEGFELNQHCALREVFSATDYTLRMGTDRSSVSLTIPGFDATNSVHPPQGASHFKLVFAITSLSSYVYDASIKGYTPIAPTFDGIHTHLYSPTFSVIAFIAEQSYTLDLHFSGPPPDTVAIVAGLGIQFYQQVNDNLYALETDSAMSILKVS